MSAMARHYILTTNKGILTTVCSRNYSKLDDAEPIGSNRSPRLPQHCACGIGSSPPESREYANVVLLQ
jgi:hypothetical protein